MSADPVTRIARDRLRRFERFSVPLLEFINQTAPLKTRIQATIGWLNGQWIIRATGRVWRVDGAEHLDGLDAPHGIIVAANHRSFFDLYVCSSYLLNHHPHLIERLFFPVRASYFYTHAVGLGLNLVLSGGSMWPPIFRDDRRSELNPLGLAQLGEVMQRGSLVGIHPEGKRGTHDDPYTLLPPKPGLGLLMEACHPDTLVVPYFTLGLSNDLGELVRRNFKPAGQRGRRVSLRFGAPLRVGELREGRSALEATQRVMEHIAALGALDREMRDVHGDAA